MEHGYVPVSTSDTKDTEVIHSVNMPKQSSTHAQESENSYI